MKKEIYIVVALSVFALLVAFILAAGINGGKNIPYGGPTAVPEPVATPEPTAVPPKPTATSSGPTAIKCTPEQREGDMCIQIYKPVCATVQIQCIKAPCNPVQQTFSNSCFACKNPLVDMYIEGECAI